ncbi:GAF domain-containing protein [Acetobacter farinalis]|uniref:GAF domain-containing protein n=1 Tax=Acetobacter farinalis TaxID=1260984 RepID=A0ABT3Q9Z1_9PROT|nr:GAF domain-containing protein [Acetobacter farinalis]MCX2562113.1 GAF domain-containing protein [Acetobacter farinalis]
MSAPTQHLTPEDLLSAAAGLLASESDPLASMANLSALIFEALPELNWAGFYLYRPYATAPATLFTLAGDAVSGAQPSVAPVSEQGISPAQGELVLGPFQGRIACTRIAMGKGVCGTAAQTRTTQCVADVHSFPGHIACDAASASELVIPLVAHGHLLGVLDLDSPRKNRFSVTEQHLLEQLVALFLAALFHRPEHSPAL